MTNAILILAIFFGTAVLTPLLGKISRGVRNGVLLVAVFASGVFFLRLYGQNGVLHGHVLNFGLALRMSPLAWFFGMIVMGLAVLVVPFSLTYMRGRERQDYFFFALMTSIGAMMGVLFAGDLLSLFFFWEIMTWSSFLNVIYYRYEAQTAGLKYFLMSLIGAYAMFVAILMVFARTGAVEFRAVSAGLPLFSRAEQITIFVLFLVGFGVKAAILPLHTWAPDAYEISPAPFTALFSGAMSKMGAYGLALVLFSLGGLKLFAAFGSVLGTPDFHYAVAWLGAITALVATFIAVVQEDAKRLLAYSSVAQVGYIVLGFGVASTFGVAGALFQALNHAIFKGMLFLVMGAVFFRTGTHHMSELGGLIKRMPYSFVVMLFGIISLAGVPPLSGFPVKWMLYEALVEKRMVFLLIVAMIASTGAFLYAYRLIVSVFLGPLPEKFENVREAPWSMRIPMLVLLTLTVLFGVRPTFALKLVAAAMAHLPGVRPLQLSGYHLTAPAGAVDPFTVAVTIGAALLIAVVLMALLWSRSRPVSDRDIHTSGEPLRPGISLKYATDFYRPFARAFWPVLRHSADRFYTGLAKNLEGLFDYLRFVYTGNGQTYALYVVLFLAFLLLFARRFGF